MKDTQQCGYPPKGWKCTRGAGHKGPCAAVPDITEDQKAVLSSASGFIGAMEIARKAIKVMKDALRQGMAHSRKSMEESLPRLESELKQCRLDHQGPVHINSNVRLFDLVRFMRSELHQAELVSDEEYSWLCAESELATQPGGGSPSRARLEDYDELEAKHRDMCARLQATVQKYGLGLGGEKIDILVCDEIARLRDSKP